MKHSLSGLLIAFFASFCAQAQLPTKSLPSLEIDPQSITVSGISSGAFMAIQMSVIYADSIQGAASVAGGIFGCAQGKTNLATDLCMKTPDQIQVADYIKLTEDLFLKAQIEDPQNLAKQKVLIINGTQDTTVNPTAGTKLAEFYKHFGASPNTEFTLPLGHGFPSTKGKVECEKTQFPWVNHCAYDGAKNILETLYGPLQNAVAKTSEEVSSFDQTEFDSKKALMQDKGNIFIPESCKLAGAKCRLHIAFHGCMQSPNIAQKAFIEDAGYNEWAASNKIVVLYPAVGSGKGNPNGCWDWFGYTGQNYLSKSASQVEVIHKMITRLLAKP